MFSGIYLEAELRGRVFFSKGNLLFPPEGSYIVTCFFYAPSLFVVGPTNRYAIMRNMCAFVLPKLFFLFLFLKKIRFCICATLFYPKLVLERLVQFYIFHV